MLRAHALSDLFSANLSPPISGIFLTTTSGHLVGTSSPAQSDATVPQDSASLHNTLAPSLTRRLAVLSALTWRHYAASVAPGVFTRSQSQADSSHTVSTHDSDVQAAKTARVRPLVVLDQSFDNSEGLLSGLIVLDRGRVVALEWVREDLLLGVVGSDAGNELPEINTNTEAGSKDSIDIESGNQRSPNQESTENQAVSGDARKEEEEHVGRILAAKGEALAVYLRKELSGFRMPKEQG